jgi:hypothetical protein
MRDDIEAGSDDLRLADKRAVVNYRTASFETYYLQGKPQPDLAWCNISYEAGHGMFLVRFAPGATSIAHEHVGHEEFVLLEGELVDSDGTVYRSGDCVSLRPGSRHYSSSPSGCVAAVFVRGGFRTLEQGENVDD